MRIGIIGLGLMGGSIAKSLKKIHSQNSYIVAYDNNPKFLHQAYEEGVIDKIAPAIGSDFSNCNVIFICVPSHDTYAIVETLLPFASKDCILTDMGCSKYELIKSLHSLIHTKNSEAHFIGGYPMAGSFETGYTSSKDFMFENAYYILTPFDDTPDFIVFILQKMIERLGALPFVLSPSYHDFALATISHLPHIIASSLVQFVRNNDGDNMHLHTLAAGGFKELTRIADLNPSLWETICRDNKEQIIKVTTRYIQSLNHFIDTLEKDNESDIKDFFATAKSYRKTLADGIHDDLVKVYTLYIDIEDECGVLASITTCLSEANLNIKDIGIMNHREYASGVVRISFASKASMLRAYEILSEKNYIIYY